MTVGDVLDNCGEYCGWAAALIAATAYGSYGLPIKSVSHLELDPLVMQSYKTFVFFFMSFLVLLLGEEIKYTFWGVAAALFWVPGSLLGVPAIKNCGMATSVGTWASIIVMLNFFWGIVIFQEGIKSLAGTIGAFLLLIVGLIGMSISAGSSSKKELEEAGAASSKEMVKLTGVRRAEIRKRVSDVETADCDDNASRSSDEGETYTAAKDPKAKTSKDHKTIFGVTLTLRQFGLLCAVINGIWGGSCLIPMHYASLAGYSGAGFLISFSSGAIIVLAFMWLGLFVYRLEQKRWNVEKALRLLPRWHFKELCMPGLISGVLFSIGMFGSILAVQLLGQAVGNSCVEFQILVGGLWGILYHREIKGRRTIVKWFASACLTVFGILWLSFEHKSDRQHRHH